MPAGVPKHLVHQWQETHAHDKLRLVPVHEPNIYKTVEVSGNSVGRAEGHYSACNRLNDKFVDAPIADQYRVRLELSGQRMPWNEPADRDLLLEFCGK